MTDEDREYEARQEAFAALVGSLPLERAAGYLRLLATHRNPPDYILLTMADQLEGKGKFRLTQNTRRGPRLKRGLAQSPDFGDMDGWTRGCIDQVRSIIAVEKIAAGGMPYEEAVLHSSPKLEIRTFQRLKEEHHLSGQGLKAAEDCLARFELMRQLLRLK